MTFVRDDKTRRAVDGEKGISIYMTSDRLEAGSTYNYMFESSELSFKFTATFMSEVRKFIKKGNLTEKLIGVGYRINDSEINHQISIANKILGRPPLSEKQLESIKSAIQEGMCILGNVARSDDGSIVVPDFKVTFVSNKITHQILSSRPN